MGIDRECRFAKKFCKNHAGGLAANAWQSL
jgi:hypothetical protein